MLLWVGDLDGFDHLHEIDAVPLGEEAPLVQEGERGAR